MKLRKTKKGFTIVELVIVIGVIGILTGILIPTFVNVTQKAEEAALKSNLANAYSAYVADAGAGKVDAEHGKDVIGSSYVENKVYYLDFLKQENIVLVDKESKQYRYENDAWGPASSGKTIENIAKENRGVCYYVDGSVNTYVDVTYLGFKVYNAEARA